MRVKTGSSFSFLQLSDFHLDKFYGTPAAENLNMVCIFPNVSTLGMLGCDSPEALVDSAIDQAYRLLPDPPFIVLSGDFMRHHDKNQTQKLTVLGETMGKFRDKFPDALLLPIIGNNDLSGHNVLNVTTEEPQTPSVSSRIVQLTSVVEEWALNNSLPCENALDSFSYGGYYSCDIDHHNLTFIQMNTIPYSSKHRPNTEEMDDPFGQFAWLDNTLASLMERKRVAFLTSHIPQGVDTYGVSQQEEKYTLIFLDLVAKYDNVIKGQLFGHTHINNLKLPPKSYNVTNPVMMTAAVSPIKFNYPTFRVVHVDKNTLCVTGFDDYHLNISNPETTEWKKFGDMEVEHRLPDGECFTVAAARSKFQDTYNNPEYWTNYLTYWAGGAGLTSAMKYDDHTIYCSMMWVTQTEFKACITALIKNPTSWYIILLSSIACTISLGLFLWFFCKILRFHGAKNSLLRPLIPRKSENIQVPRIYGDLSWTPGPERTLPTTNKS